MKLKLLTSALCRSRAHCMTCRELSDRGKQFRASISDVYDVEGDDWLCPQGVDWIAAPDRPEPPKRQPPTAEQVAEAEALAAEQAQHRAIDICRACEHARSVKALGVTLTFCGSPLWPSSDHKTCGCLMDVKARIPGMSCPQGKW